MKSLSCFGLLLGLATMCLKKLNITLIRMLFSYTFKLTFVFHYHLYSKQQHRHTTGHSYILILQEMESIS